MKYNFTKSLLTLTIAGLTSAASAQTMGTESTDNFQKRDFRTWSIGLNGGILTAATPFNGENNGDFRSPQISWGYGAYIKKQILPSFGLQADFLAGTVKGVRANTIAPGAAQDASSYNARINWAGSLKANFTVANLSLNQKRSFLSPYLTAGAGYMSNSVNVQNTPGAANTTFHNNFFVPVGAGFKLGLSKVVNLDFGYDVNFMKSRNFDGVVGNFNDRFAYAHAGIEIALGKKNTSQLQNFSPIAALREESAAEASALRTRLAAAEQARMRDQEQYMKDLGDDDMDGVANKFDKCAGTPTGTVVDGAGCPIKAPAPQQIIREKVIVTEADRQVVGEAIKNLEFETGKATIKERSYATLDRVAALLVEKTLA
ncbi:OmpA family protein [Mucilaginibacter antarcticus]|uniref:OmpA family protein n=1 Tax=Mucilaginibacter antarcticus TaxID=1855725 RepID=UPI00363F5F12